MDGWTVPNAVVSEGHGPDVEAFVWGRFFTHEVDNDGKLWLKFRWWGYGPKEDTWERALKFDPRKVRQYCRRKGLPDPSGLEALLSW